MARSNADLLALKAELTNDPKGYGLTTLAEDDEANADKLNLVRSTLTVDRTNVPARELRKCIRRTEFNAATAADRDWIDLQLSGDGMVDTSPGEIRTGMLQIFGSGTTTLANFQAKLSETSNRIEHMFRANLLQEGGSVTPSDIANARNAT